MEKIYSVKCEGGFWEKKKLQKLPYFEENSPFRQSITIPCQNEAGF
jgi:hypothetical protein